MKFVKQFLPIFLALQASLLASEPVQLAEGGKALLPIYVPAESSARVQELAVELGEYLSKITGGEFKIVTERPPRAIVVGTRATVPEILPEPAKPLAPSARERYRLHTSQGSLAIVGETELAVQNGLFELLHEVGYRQFFPSKAWEVIPRRPDLQVDIDKIAEPAFARRFLFLAVRRKPAQLVEATEFPETEAAFADWQRKNRGVSGYALNSGHAYQAIIRRNAEAFKSHPEWVTRKGTWNDVGSGLYEPKFVVENEELRRVVRQDALEWLRANPDADSYSIDPSDGRGWPKESSIGTPSDQAAFLANDVMRGIRTEFPDKRVAFYAYNLHSPPPKIELEKGIIVSVATKFNRSVPVSELMQGWRDKGAELGIRDYIAVWHGNLDLPGGNYTASNPREFLRSIRKFHADGARYYGAEMTSGGWATFGFSLYAGMQALWSPESTDYDPLFADFLETSFLKAKGPLRDFFEMIDSAASPIISEVLTGDMYKALDAGLKLEKDAAVQTRILQLVAYTRYVELMDSFIKNQGEEKRDAYKRLAEFTIRCRRFPTVPTADVFSRRPPLLPIWETVSEIGAKIMQDKKAPFTEHELRDLMATRLQEIKPLGFEPKAFSKNLVRSALRESTRVENFTFSRVQSLLWLAEKPGEELPLKVLSRETLDSNQPIIVSLYYTEDPEGAASSTTKVPADNQVHSVIFKASDPGLYSIGVSDLAGTSEFSWPEESLVFVPAGSGKNTTISGIYNAWFFVPAGGDCIGGYSEVAKGRIVDSAGELIHSFHSDKGPSYFNVKIPPAEKGRFFKFENATGKKLLMTVPPYLARQPSELPIPKEALTEGNGHHYP